MKKFWMMGGAIIAVSITAMVWNPGSVRSSESLLGKAQSEFATKARDALLQRYMVQSPATPAAPSATPPAVTPEPTVASSVPAAPAIAPATMAEAEPTFDDAAPEAPKVVLASAEAPAVQTDVVSSPAPLPVATTDNVPAARLQLAALQEEPAVPVSQQRIAAAAPASEIANADTPATTRAAPRRHGKAERKMRSAPKPARTKFAYRSEYPAPGYTAPYNLRTLRAHAPQIAAAIAQYMR